MANDKNKHVLSNVVTLQGTPYTFPSAPQLGDVITTPDGERFTITQEFINSLFDDNAN